MAGCIYFTDRVKLISGVHTREWDRMMWGRTFTNEFKISGQLPHQMTTWVDLTGFNISLTVHEHGDYAWVIFDTKEEASLFRLAFNLS
jgi:hypothetical protein